MLDLDCKHEKTVSTEDRYKPERRICTACGAELAPLATIQHRNAKSWRRCVESWIYIALLAHDDGDDACEKQHRDGAAEALWNAALLERADEREYERVRDLRRQAHEIAHRLTTSQTLEVQSLGPQHLFRERWPSEDPEIRAWLIGLGLATIDGLCMQVTELGKHVLSVLGNIESLPKDL